MEEAAAGIQASGGRGWVVEADVREPAQVRALVAAAVAQTGRLDIMVNNAGVGYEGPIAAGEPERWREMLETNVLAVLVGAQEAIRAMRACGAAGHIVNVSSIRGRSEASGVYGATKAAVDSVATSLRQELEHDTIRVVNIVPGATATNFGRNFPPGMLEGLLRAAGIEEPVPAGQHLPDHVLDRVARAARVTLASAEDIARAILFAVTQPIELNVFEMVVRPQKQLEMP
jgi:NADP-dependent 3-hydroxy acid dehydrogenase YdfG